MLRNYPQIRSHEPNYINKNYTHHYFLNKLKNIKNPIILELGVNQGGSTLSFLKNINKYGGELYSIDINDFSKIIEDKKFKNVPTEKWHFFNSNDVDVDNILSKFPILKEGIDLLFIDSYHDESHVKKILEKWYIYVKKFGYIYFDDTENYLYKKSKNFTLSVNNYSIDQLVRNFYYRNYDQLIFTKYFSGSGLSELCKTSELGTTANFSSKIWNHNYIFGKAYLFLKKILYILKKKDIEKPNSSKRINF
jgi:hypothetical protein